MVGCIDFRFRGYGDFILVIVQIGSPPAKRADGNNIMPAQTHQLHVPEAFPALIPVYKHHLVPGVIQAKYFLILFTPLCAFRVAEKAENRI